MIEEDYEEVIKDLEHLYFSLELQNQEGFRPCDVYFDIVDFTLDNMGGILTFDDDDDYYGGLRDQVEDCRLLYLWLKNTYALKMPLDFNAVLTQFAKFLHIDKLTQRPDLMDVESREIRRYECH